MIYLKLFLVFFKVGLFSFGGGYAILPLMQHEVVDVNKWINFSEFMDIVAVVLLIFAVRKVIENQGAPSTQVSAFALCSFLFAAAGSYYSLKSFKQGTARKSLSVITIIIGGVLFLLWFMIFILGIAG